MIMVGPSGGLASDTGWRGGVTGRRDGGLPVCRTPIQKVQVNAVILLIWSGSPTVHATAAADDDVTFFFLLRILLPALLQLSLLPLLLLLLLIANLNSTIT